jgi:hypothetical protein
MYQLNQQPFKLIALINSIPRNWKKRIKYDKKKLKEISQASIQKLQNINKPAKLFHRNFMENIVTKSDKAESKWNILIGERINNETWNTIYYTPHLAKKKETKLKFIQMKILHRILPTNEWLYKCRLTNSKNCTFCQIYSETIEHLLWECPNTKTIWLLLKEWLD